MTGPQQHHDADAGDGRANLKRATSPNDVPPLLPSYQVSLSRVVILGTTLWFVGFVVLLFFIPQLQENDAMIWLWTCLTGSVLGLVGLAIYRWQRAAARRGSRGAQTSSLD